MNWLGIGVVGSGWELRFRELEHLVRRLFHVSRQDPEQELPGLELSDGERLAALRREATRRMVMGRR